MPRFLSVLFVFPLCLTWSVVVRAQPLDERPCDLTQISQSVRPDKSRKWPIEGIAISFSKPAERLRIPLPNGEVTEKSVIVPTLTLRSNATVLRDEVISRIHAKMPDKIGPIDIVRSSFRATNTYIKNRTLHIDGSVWVEKWASMDGFECRWKGKLIGGYLRCSRTTWKTRLFEKEIFWKAYASFSTQTKLPARANYKPGAAIATAELFEKSTVPVIKASADVDARISNDLESFVYDLVGWFASALNGVFDNWNVTSSLRFTKGAQDRVFDVRKELYPDEQVFVYSDPSGIYQREGARGFWQIFIDNLKFQRDRSGFSSRDDGGMWLDIAFKLDDLEFAKALGRNRARSQPAVDIFTERFFCADNVGVRKRIKEYLVRIASQFEAKQTVSSTEFNGSFEGLVDAAKELYGNVDSVRFLIKNGYVKADNRRIYHGKLPAAETLAQIPGPVLAWDNIDTYSNYFNLSKEERRCVEARATRHRGSPDSIFPFDDFGSCLNGAGVSVIQSEILNDVLKSIDPKIGLLKFNTFRSPVSKPMYRGWYYCYRNTRLCAGRNDIFWWQQPSMFDARGSRHKGIDLIGDDFVGSTALLAVVGGRVSFSNRDNLGWGNALIIPFKSGGKTMLVVYAHVPDSSRAFHNKNVKAGASLGSTGCSGNAGDGQGNCDTYCVWAGRKRTDEHLHLEILEKTSSGFKKLNAAKFLSLKVASDGRRFRAHCKVSEERTVQAK